MPRERAVSEVKEPHLISLKVLRLSRPSLSEQHTIPVGALSHHTPELKEASQHSHTYPSHPLEDPFIFTPLLTLPPAFGSVYIGETFSCCLSASNEAKFLVTNVKINAQMQTPSQALRLDLGEDDEGTELAPGGSLQKIVNYDLKEEGNHVLAVMMAYTDPRKPPDGAIRTFKKLYQFVAQQCIMVRTKAGALPGGNAILEAQLENLSESPVALHRVSMKTKWKWSSLNWDMIGLGATKEAPLLRSRDVIQVAFLLEPGDDLTDEKSETLEVADRDALGQLSIEWKTAFGDKGFLRTGKLVLPPV